MTPTTQDAALTPELEAQIRKLSRADKDRVQDILDEGDGFPDGPLQPLSDEWKAEIKRRLEAIRQGDVETYTVEEFFTRLDRKCRREGDE